MTDPSTTPAVQAPAARISFAQLRTHPDVLAALAEAPDKLLLEAQEARLGPLSPRIVAPWAHACAMAWKRWDAEGTATTEAYVLAILEAVGLPVGGNTPAGGHTPDPDQPRAAQLAKLQAPAPEHDVDTSSPARPAPAPMRPGI